MNDYAAWLLPGILLELAILMFQWFRRIHRYRVFLVIPGLMGLFSLLMFVLTVATLASEGPGRFEGIDGIGLLGAFVGLGGLILAVPRVKLGYRKNRHGDEARRRDELDPPRRRPFLVDLLGCLLIGAALLVGFVLLMGLVMVYAKREAQTSLALLPPAL